MKLSDFFDEFPAQFHFSDEVQAVKDDLKLISYSSGVRGSDFTNEIEKQALDLGLLVITSEDRRIELTGAIRQYVVKPENLWRVQAMDAFSKTSGMHPWTAWTERFMSSLLGYTEEQIDFWLNSLSSAQAGFGSTTVYFLVKDGYREKLKILGDRCLHPDCGEDGIDLFFPSRRVVPKIRAFELVPRGTHLARMGIGNRFAAGLFDNFSDLQDSSYLSSTIAPMMIPEINAALRTSIAIFGPDGWTA